jgi:peptidyl-prolyl cis-trans isomerase SurA
VIETEVQKGMKREDAQKMVDEKRGELIANLINEELLIQKAKELGLEPDIDAAINARFVEIMKQNNLLTLDAMYEEMRRQGVEPTEIRELWRKQITKERVIQREVSSKLYWSFSGKELKDYYEKNKSKFTKPEMIGLSEMFLGFAGREPDKVREKAKQLIAQARGGADFAKMVAENSDRPNAAQTKGKVEMIPLKDLDVRFTNVIKDLKVGGISDPVEVDDTGITVLRVDDRVAASNESQFDEAAIRMEMMKERAVDEQKKFMSQLREESYIKISDTYRPLVSPILFSEERKTKPNN